MQYHRHIGRDNVNNIERDIDSVGVMMEADAGCDLVYSNGKNQKEKSRIYLPIVTGKSLKPKGKIFSSCARSCLI